MIRRLSTIFAKLVASALLATLVISPASAQEADDHAAPQMIEYLTLDTLQEVVALGGYSVLRTDKDEKLLTIRRDLYPDFNIVLEDCVYLGCRSILVARADGELAGLPPRILNEANLRFVKTHVIEFGPERAIAYRRFISLEGGTTVKHLLIQLFAFDAGIIVAAEHLREGLAEN